MSATKRSPAEPRTRLSRTELSGAQPPAGTAFYALQPGGWRDYWTIIHPPYTAWHLSYVLLGAALAPAPDPRIVAGALLAFGLAVGVGSHAFDELRGRPLGTRIPAPGAGCARSDGARRRSGSRAGGVDNHRARLLDFCRSWRPTGGGLRVRDPRVPLGPRLRACLGSLPVVATAYAVGAPSLSTGLAAMGAALLSLAQRRLSTPVRALRRRAVAVHRPDPVSRRIDAGYRCSVPDGGSRKRFAPAVVGRSADQLWCARRPLALASFRREIRSELAVWVLLKRARQTQSLAPTASDGGATSRHTRRSDYIQGHHNPRGRYQRSSISVQPDSRYLHDAVPCLASTRPPKERRGTPSKRQASTMWTRVHRRESTASMPTGGGRRVERAVMLYRGADLSHHTDGSSRRQPFFRVLWHATASPSTVGRVPRRAGGRQHLCPTDQGPTMRPAPSCGPADRGRPHQRYAPVRRWSAARPAPSVAPDRTGSPTL